VPFHFAAAETDTAIGDPASMKQFATGLWSYLRGGAGFFGTSPVSNTCFTRSGLRKDGDPHADECDLQLHFVPSMVNPDPEASWYKKMNLTGEHGDIFKDYKKLPRGLLFLPTLNIPKSEGSIELRSADPFEHPRISPGYLADPYDRKALVEGLKKCRAIAKAPALSEILSSEVVEPRIEHPRDSDEYLEEYVRRFARTVYHPMSTCRMGPDSDPMAVLDAQCRVRGAKGLRVVDASVMPSAMSGNTNAPTIMIAEKISADIMASA
jgi:choline dehydrogenase